MPMYIRRKGQDVWLSEEATYLAAKLVEENREWYEQEKQRIAEAEVKRAKAVEEDWGRFRLEDAPTLPYPYNLLFGELYTREEANEFYYEQQYNTAYKYQLAGLWWAVRSLPPHKRKFVECYYDAGVKMTDREVAAIFGVAPHVAARHRKDGLELLKKGIRREAWTDGYDHISNHKTTEMAECLQESGVAEPINIGEFKTEYFENWWYVPYGYDPEGEELYDLWDDYND